MVSAAALALLLPSLFLAAVPPVIERPVTDTPGLLLTDQRDEVARELVRLRQATGAQMAVLIVDSTGGEPIEDYAMRAAQAWRGGQGDASNGLLYVLAVKDRRMRLEVGYGLEDSLPDDAVRRLLDEQGALMREGDAGRALVNIIQGVHARLESSGSEPAPAPVVRGEASAIALGIPALLLLFISVCAVLKLKTKYRGEGYLTVAFCAVLCLIFSPAIHDVVQRHGFDPGTFGRVLALGSVLLGVGWLLAVHGGQRRWGGGLVVATFIGLGSAWSLSPAPSLWLYAGGITLVATLVLALVSFLAPFDFLLRLLVSSMGGRIPSPIMGATVSSSNSSSGTFVSSDTSSSSSWDSSSSSSSSDSSSSSSSSDWSGGGGDFGGGGSSSSW